MQNIDERIIAPALIPGLEFAARAIATELIRVRKMLANGGTTKTNLTAAELSLLPQVDAWVTATDVPTKRRGRQPGSKNRKPPVRATSETSAPRKRAKHKPNGRGNIVQVAAKGRQAWAKIARQYKQLGGTGQPSKAALAQLMAQRGVSQGRAASL